MYEDRPSRTSRGQFAPGISGNAGGRPRSEGLVREQARQHGAEAIQRLAELMRSENERVAVAACVAILDRGYGKPAVAGQEQTGASLIDALKQLASNAAANAPAIRKLSAPAMDVEPAARS